MLIRFANDLKLGPGAVFFFLFFNIYLFEVDLSCGAWDPVP